jgi:hypothetical protein
MGVKQEKKTKIVILVLGIRKNQIIIILVLETVLKNAIRELN